MSNLACLAAMARSLPHVRPPSNALRLRGDLGQPEIENFRLPASCYEDVGRLDVPVDKGSFRPQTSLLPKGVISRGRRRMRLNVRRAAFTELVVVLGTNVRPFVLLPVSPDEFHGVQFRRVGRKKLQP